MYVYAIASIRKFIIAMHTHVLWRTTFKFDHTNLNKLLVTSAPLQTSAAHTGACPLLKEAHVIQTGERDTLCGSQCERVPAQHYKTKKWLPPPSNPNQRPP